MLYLKNMLKNDPTNEGLMYSLAERSLYGNKRDLAYRLLKLLKGSKDKVIRSKAYFLSYKIAKEDYFYLLQDHKIEEAKKLYKELQGLYHTILSEHMYEDKNLVMLYKEALFLNDQKSYYKLTKQLIINYPNNIEYLENGYYLAYKFKKYKRALQYIDKLIVLDKKRVLKWKDAKYFMLYNHISLKKAKDYLMKEAKGSNLWMEKFAEFYLAQKSYKDASKLYMKLFKQSTTHKEEIYYWIHAMNALQAGNYMSDAVTLGSRYEKSFYKERKVGSYLLKLYMAANEPQKARKLAKAILQLRRKK
jgi:predicted Zn-dependent protease